MILGVDPAFAVSSGLVPFFPKAIIELLLAVSLTKVWNQYRV
jgi:hypothetical protein